MATREQHPQSRHFPRLLRLSNERRGEEAAGHARDEGATIHHSIT